MLLFRVKEVSVPPVMHLVEAWSRGDLMATSPRVLIGVKS